MKRILLLIAVSYLLQGCTTSSNKADVQTFYYDFVGFESSEYLSELYRLVKAEYAFNDYIITTQDEMTAFPRGSIISKDSLHFLHPVIHRIEPIENTDELKEGDVVMQVLLVPSNEDQLPSFAYKRFLYSAENGLEQKFDFGSHPIIGVRKNEFLDRWPYIAEEFARASFK